MKDEEWDKRAKRQKDRDNPLDTLNRFSSCDSLTETGQGNFLIILLWAIALLKEQQRKDQEAPKGT